MQNGTCKSVGILYDKTYNRNINNQNCGDKKAVSPQLWVLYKSKS